MDRHAWSEALSAYKAADAEQPLDADALEGLASAAFWTGDIEVCLKAWERAYTGYLEAATSAAPR